jgi:hypothetical protein
VIATDFYLSLAVMIVAGIGLAHAITRPRACDARWRRRGAILALAAAGVAAVLGFIRPGSIRPTDALAIGLLLALAIAQWAAAWRGWWGAQRGAGALVYLAFIAPAAGLQLVAMTAYPGRHSGTDMLTGVTGAIGAALGSALVGGTLAAALIPPASDCQDGWYETLRGLLLILLVVLFMRLLLSAMLGCWPWWGHWGIDSRAPYARGPRRDWPVAGWLLGRYFIGGIVPAVTMVLTLRLAGREPAPRWRMALLLWLTLAAILTGELCARMLAMATSRAF